MSNGCLEHLLEVVVDFFNFFFCFGCQWGCMFCTFGDCVFFHLVHLFFCLVQYIWGGSLACELWLFWVYMWLYLWWCWYIFWVVDGEVYWFYIVCCDGWATIRSDIIICSGCDCWHLIFKLFCKYHNIIVGKGFIKPRDGYCMFLIAVFESRSVSMFFLLVFVCFLLSQWAIFRWCLFYVSALKMW